MAKARLQWHEGFSAALHIEFEAESDKIKIETEHELGRKPMRIDVLIVRKYARNLKETKN